MSNTKLYRCPHCKSTEVWASIPAGSDMLVKCSSCREQFYLRKPDHPVAEEVADFELPPGPWRMRHTNFPTVYDADGNKLCECTNGYNEDDMQEKLAHCIATFPELVDIMDQELSSALVGHPKLKQKVDTILKRAKGEEVNDQCKHLKE